MALWNIFERLPTQNELTGSFGEWLTKVFAKTLPGALVLHDILIDGAENHTSQIDLLIVGNKGIYVIEVKTYTGAIVYGNPRNTKWYYYNHSKKYEIYSPLKQNRKHVEYLKSFLKQFGDVPCYSVIVMICEDFKISGVIDSDTAICSSLPAMKRAIYTIADGKPSIWDDSKKQEIYSYIRDKQHCGKAARAEHKESVAAYTKELDEMKQQRKCPYCKVDLVLRNGKFGTFFGCPNYPKCKFTLK